MPASKTKSIRLPNDLYDAAEIRAKALGYASVNEYHISLTRYDCIVQGEHPLTRAIAKMPSSERDKMDAHLLMLTKRGKGQRGQLLAHILERIGIDKESLKKALGL